MTPFLLALLPYLPTAIEIVRKWMDSDAPKGIKRAHAVKEIMEQCDCSENQARCLNATAYGGLKTENKGVKENGKNKRANK